MWKIALPGLVPSILVCFAAWFRISSLQQQSAGLEDALFEATQDLQARGHQLGVAQGVSVTSYSLTALIRKLGDNANTTDHPEVNSTGGITSLTSHGSSHGEAHGGHEGHQHDVLTFLIIALLVGTSITHLATLESFRSLPYTVVLFVLGLLFSVIYYQADLEGSMGVFGRSHDMWMKIDPHLLLFTMLPALLTGDAMVIDTTVAKRVGAQCIYLAGPGVLINAGLTGVFLHEFMGNWPWLLCFTMGSILGATDPVAVVGMLKELGASPTLTVQIQGESLLNDGTAIVLFKVFYDMLSGEEYDFRDILIMFVYMVICSWFLGMIIGGIFSSWITAASNKLEHNSSLIQISLTICCAYCAFIFAEGIIGISGVLSTVAASLILADNMWPHIVSQEAMHEVWHVFEYMGNTLIFFLAGALTGSVAINIEAMDYVRLLLLYLVIMVIRALTVFASRPMLWRLSPDRTAVSLEDAIVMTWGGLRGAVGLALAIQVRHDRAGGMIEQSEADRVMFFTGGIAALTLMLNATTCPKLMQFLGLTATTASKKRMMLNIHSRLTEAVQQQPPKVRGILDSMMENVRHHIEHECQVQENEDGVALDEGHFHGMGDLLKNHKCQCGGKMFLKAEHLLERYYAAKEEFSNVSDHYRVLLGWSDNQPLLALEEDMIELVKTDVAESSMVRSVTESLLALVCSEYWNQIRKQQFVKGTRSADILLSSATAAFQFASKGLVDLHPVKQQLGLIDESASFGVRRSRTFSKISSLASDETGVLSNVVHSHIFKTIMIIVILANAVVIVVEDDSIAFLVIDCIFLMIYTVEFLLKLAVMRCKYFSDGWNALDFMCVVLGVFGICMKIAVEVGAADKDSVSSEMQLMRLNRIFKIMRIMRVVVIMKFARQMHAKFKGKTISKELATQLETISTLKAFVEAHTVSQNKLCKYLASNETGVSRLDECEEARCIIESWTQVYHAIVLGAAEIEKVESDAPWIIGGMAVMRESTAIIEEFTGFVMSAAKAGILKERQAESIIHPMQDVMRKAGVLFSDCHSGIHRSSLKQIYEQSHESTNLPSADEHPAYSSKVQTIREEGKGKTLEDKSDMNEGQIDSIPAEGPIPLSSDAVFCEVHEGAI